MLKDQGLLYSELDIRMRQEWDRRIDHDYRYWMSDGVESDSLMWETGKRDFDLLFQHVDLSNTKEKVAIELGCGVGRLLRVAASIFDKVFGVDVSTKALDNAKRLLADLSNIQFIQGNGHDMSFFEDSCVDVAYSFAALGSMPVRVFASYMTELSRVIKLGGQIALQIYLGNNQGLAEEDTAGLRSYEFERFIAAMKVSGFSLIHLEELVLHFEVSDKEIGLVAYMATLRKESSPKVDATIVAQILGAEHEHCAGALWKGSFTEYCMAVFRTQQFLKEAKVHEASASLEFALKCYHEPEVTFFKLLDVIRGLDSASAERLDALLKDMQQSEVGEGTDAQSSNGELDQTKDISSDGSLFKNNLKILYKKFPQFAERLATEYKENSKPINVEYAEDGSPVLIFEGIALDQKSRPERSAEMWVSRTLDETRMKDASALVVAGAATGYHLRMLIRSTELPIVLFEPKIEILRGWLSIVDASEVLLRLVSICTETSEIFQCDELGEAPELLIHPQSRAISGDLINVLSRNIITTRGLRSLTPSIAVVGPIYGGTLPMTDYVGRALAQLGQRVHVYNLGEFHKSYTAVPSFIASESRRDIIESKYVDFLSDLVLEGIKEKPVDLLISLAQAPLTPRVLTELRRRNVVTAMWFVEDCARFPTWKTIAPYYDYMFIIQRDKYLKLIEEAGAGRCYYLPTACDPTVHKPIDLSPNEASRFGSKISFVGAGYHNRRKMLARLAKLDFKIWGTEWPEARPFDTLVQEQGRRVSPEDYVKVFNATEINVNLHSSSERDGVDPYGDFINPRTFELASSCAFQLVDRRTLLPELFKEDEEVICFSDEKELQDKIDYYSVHPDECKKIALQARKRALAEHTYVHRMSSMLGYIYADRYSDFKVRSEISPWAKTLKAATEFPSVKDRLERAYKLGREPTLDSIICDIQVGKGELSEEESKLLFLHHVRKFIVTANEFNEGKTK